MAYCYVLGKKKLFQYRVSGLQNHVILVYPPISFQAGRDFGDPSGWSPDSCKVFFELRTDADFRLIGNGGYVFDFSPEACPQSGV